MCLLLQFNNCSLIDHRDYTLDLYKNVPSDENEVIPLGLTSKIFCILNKKKVPNRKRSLNSGEFHEETLMLQKRYESFSLQIKTDLKTKINNKYNIMDTTAVREFSKELSENTIFDHIGVSGGNNSDRPLKCAVKGDYFLIPEKSSFLCGCVKEQCLKLKGNTYNLLIADPPWWNKYIRRLKGSNDKLSYSMMYNEDIAAIPVKDLLSSNSIVAVWCTNSPSNIAAVKDLIFPSWGVNYLTTWYWLKITVDIEPCGVFSPGCGKQPYERLIIGKIGDVKDVPESHMFLSVPSALHSHKPPLFDLLTPYLMDEKPQMLELFARYLLPNTTSVGYEPLKWQHISLYDTVTR